MSAPPLISMCRGYFSEVTDNNHQATSHSPNLIELFALDWHGIKLPPVCGSHNEHVPQAVDLLELCSCHVTPTAAKPLPSTQHHGYMSLCCGVMDAVLYESRYHIVSEIVLRLSRVLSTLWMVVVLVMAPVG
jgi:hypothetical protein